MTNEVNHPSRAERPRAFPQSLLFGISFWGGLQIMVLEVCGFRVLQTNLGSSVVVTGTLLTLIMVLLSLGYYTGGLLSQQLNNPSWIFVILASAAVYTALVTTPLLTPIVGLSVMLRSGLYMQPYLRAVIPAATLSILLYGPPVFAMSMISPYFIRLRMLDASEAAGDAGRQSGFFMSLSTAGSIVGTMVASYLLVPLYGVPFTVLATDGVFFVLVAWGIVYFTRSTRISRVTTVCFLLFGVLSFGASSVWHATRPHDPSVIYEAESHYGRIKVVKTVDDMQQTVLNYYPSEFMLHSALYPEDPIRKLRGLIFLVPGMLRPPKSILVLGSAAGGVARQVEQAFPDAHVTGVDIDPQIHEVAKTVFGVDTQRTTLVTQDARVFLTETQDRYDLVIVDVFSGEMVPVHCVTREFFQLVHNRLTPGGGVFVNVAMNDIPWDLPTQDEPFRPIRHLESTLFAAGFLSVFENVFFHSLFVFPDELTLPRMRAELLAQVDDTTRHKALRSAAGLAAYTTVSVPSARTHYRPFTDDWTPEVQIELKTNAPMLLRALRSANAKAPKKADALADIVLERLLDEINAPGDLTRIRQTDALIARLNGFDGAWQAGDVERAAYYLRFPSAKAMLAQLAPRTAWARVAALYAQLYRSSFENDAEGVLRTVGRLNQELANSSEHAQL